MFVIFQGYGAENRRGVGVRGFIGTGIREKFAGALVTVQLFIRLYPGPVPRIEWTLVNDETLERDSKDRFVGALVTVQLFIRQYPGPVPRIEWTLVNDETLERDSKERFVGALVIVQLFICHYGSRACAENRMDAGE